MFSNLKKKTKNNFNWEKQSIFLKFWLSNFIFVLYTLISPNLQIILKKTLHIWVDLKKYNQFLKYEKINYKLILWDLDQNSKNTIYPLGVKSLFLNNHVPRV